MFKLSTMKTLLSMTLVIGLQGCVQTLDSLAVSTDDVFQVEIGELDPNSIAKAVAGSFSYSIQEVPSDQSLGLKELKLRVMDGNGSSVDIIIPIEIVNTKSQVIRLNGADVITLSINTSWVDPGIQLQDIVNGTISIAAEELVQQGIVSGRVLFNVPGEYVLTYQSTNLSGNVSNRLVRTIRIVDNEAPSLRVSSNLIWYEGTPITLDDIQVSDNYDDLSIEDVTIDWNGLQPSSPQIGTYNVRFRVTDSSNNTTQANRTYTIIYSLDRLFVVLDELVVANDFSQISSLLLEYETHQGSDTSRFLQRRNQFIATHQQAINTRYLQIKQSSDITTAMQYLKSVSVFFEPSFVNEEIYRLVLFELNRYYGNRMYGEALNLIDSYRGEITDSQYNTSIRQTLSYMASATTRTTERQHRDLLTRYERVLGGRLNINYITTLSKIIEMVFMDGWNAKDYQNATIQLQLERDNGFMEERLADRLVQQQTMIILDQMFARGELQAEITSFASGIRYTYKTINQRWYIDYILDFYEED